jgi:adenosine deaminase
LETDMKSEVELVEKHGIMTPAQVDQALATAREASFIR